MMQKLSFTKVIAAVIKLVEKNTEERCYDIIPDGAALPHYHPEIIQQLPINTKTMFKERYQVVIHAWAMCEKSSAPIYSLVEKLEEAMTEAIELPDGYELISQDAKGLQRIVQDEDGSKHAVMNYEFDIAYGFKMKI